MMECTVHTMRIVCGKLSAGKDAGPVTKTWSDIQRQDSRSVMCSITVTQKLSANGDPLPCLCLTSLGSLLKPVLTYSTNWTNAG